MINLSIATVWLGFSPVAYKASVYYHTTVTAINWLSIGVIVCSILFGILWSWLMNKMGLKASMLFSAWMMAIGAGLRICSTIEELPHTVRLIFLFTGQYMVAIVQPLALYSSPKMAAIWFPSHQRSLATTAAGMANPVGIVLTGVISPLFVNRYGMLQTRNMLIVYAALCAVCAIMTSFVMRSDGPPTPPSLGGTMTSSKDFIAGVKKVLRNKNYVVLMTAVGTGIGLYSSFATLGEQVLCPWGYSDTIAGVCSSAMTGAGLCGAVMASLIVDRTKLFAESLKFMFISASIATIVFSVTHKIYMGYLICVEMALLGFSAFGIAPIGMETGAEVTFPVGVSIGTALIQIMGQIMSTIMILILQSIGRPMTAEELIHYGSKCHSDQTTFAPNTTTSTTVQHTTITYDLTVSTYVVAGFITLIALTFLFLFRPTYHRMNAERQADALHVAIERNSGLPGVHSDSCPGSETESNETDMGAWDP